MKTLYTYPARFRPTPHNEECLYSVSPGIPLTTAVNELEGILGATHSILTDRPTKDTHFEVADSLIDCALNHVYHMQTSSLFTSEELDEVGMSLVDACNSLAPHWKESTTYGVIMLINMAIGLTRSIIESCKRGAA